jgi:hypothetical protein
MFLEFAEGKVSAEKLAEIDWDTWYKGNGLPPVVNTFDDTLQKQCQALAEKWTSGEGSNVDDVKGKEMEEEGTNYERQRRNKVGSRRGEFTRRQKEDQGRKRKNKRERQREILNFRETKRRNKGGNRRASERDGGRRISK